MFVYQTSTRGRSITLLNEHAQFDFRYCSPVADRTRSKLGVIMSPPFRVGDKLFFPWASVCLSAL